MVSSAAPPITGSALPVGPAQPPSHDDADRDEFGRDGADFASTLGTVLAAPPAPPRSDPAAEPQRDTDPGRVAPYRRRYQRAGTDAGAVDPTRPADTRAASEETPATNSDASRPATSPDASRPSDPTPTVGPDAGGPADPDAGRPADPAAARPSDPAAATTPGAPTAGPTSPGVASMIGPNIAATDSTAPPATSAVPDVAAIPSPAAAAVTATPADPPFDHSLLSDNNERANGPAISVGPLATVATAEAAPPSADGAAAPTVSSDVQEPVAGVAAPAPTAPFDQLPMPHIHERSKAGAPTAAVVDPATPVGGDTLDAAVPEAATDVEAATTGVDAATAEAAPAPDLAARFAPQPTTSSSRVTTATVSAPAAGAEHPVAADLTAPWRAFDRHRLATLGPRLTVDLSNEGVGGLRVEAAATRGVVHLTLAAADEATRATLASRLPELRHELEASGVTVGDLQLNGQSAGESRAGSGDGREPGPTAPAARSSGPPGRNPASTDAARQPQVPSAGAGRLDLRL